MSKSIGIDFGTTNSAAGIKKVHVEIIRNSERDLAGQAEACHQRENDVFPACLKLWMPSKRLRKILN